MQSPSQLRQRLRQQRVNGDSTPTGPGRFGRFFELGRGRVGPDLDRVGPNSDRVGPDSDLVGQAPAAAESA